MFYYEVSMPLTVDYYVYIIFMIENMRNALYIIH